jgi:plastocyanin
MRSPAPFAIVAATTAALALGASGCAIKSDNADKVAGKQVFVQKCGSCHVLSRAGTKGVTGPNLDAAFVRSRLDGLGQSAIEGVIRQQIAFPSRPGSAGTGVMPAKLVTGKKAQDVAAYVAQSVGKAGKDTGLLATAVGGVTSSKPAVEAAGVLKIPAAPDGQLLFVNAKATGTAGPATIEMPNASGIDHNIAIKGLGAGAIVKNGTSSFKATLKPGTYTYFCEVPGHEAAGMKGTLTVK